MLRFLKSMKHDLNTKISAVHVCISGVYAKNIKKWFQLNLSFKETRGEDQIY